MRIIFLSGHNFESPGCSVKIRNEIITEWDLTNWLVAEVFKRERSIKIDTIIKARNNFGDLVEEVNSLNGDILISCHFNAANGLVQGTEVLYAASSVKGEKLARLAQGILVKHLNLNDRGLKPTKQGERGGSILNKTKPVAILIEPFFLDSVTSFKMLGDYMNKTIDAIKELYEELEKNKI